MVKYFSLLKKYHLDISEEKQRKLKLLFNIYNEKNKKINLVSRKDFDNFFLHHVIHSLSILKLNLLSNKNLTIIDVGTGGGFPGIPLAILLDRNQFILIDSIKKKIDSLHLIINDLKLKNVKLLNQRAENIIESGDVVLSRAVSSTNNILKWSKNLIKENGKIYLYKGGDVEKELKNILSSFTIYKLDDIYSEEYFTDKKIIEIQL